VGDDSAHPNYDHAGEVVDMEPDEFVILSEILNEFFDELYVKPAKHKAAIEARKREKRVRSSSQPPPAQARSGVGL
jgi:hypothetical protein